MTGGQDTWSARCVETRTAGAAGGPGKPTGRNPGRAPRSDPTRTRPLLGAPTRFVLAAGGHAKALGSPPGAPRNSYRTGVSESADPAEWLQASVEHPGSWWQDWSDWIAKHTPATEPAPAQFGSQAYPPLADAPGEFVHRRAI